MAASIAYVVNNAAFFVSHRLPIAMAAREQGHSVALFTGLPGSASVEPSAERALQEAGIAHTRVSFTTAGINPVVEFVGLLQLTYHMRRCRPDLIHCASPKGLLYGGFAARASGAKALVLAVSGMGYAFTQGAQGGTLRRVISLVYRSLATVAFRHKNARVIVQNDDDRQALIASGLVQADRIVLIPGSGVRLGDFEHLSPEQKERVVLFPARLLLDKGVMEFVEAARRLKASHPDWRFVLAGAADHTNPSSVPEARVREWVEEGAVEWAGHVYDMTPWYGRAGIVCLPSYREGMPKALLEAAAAACAVVTTDTIGCRQAIIPGETGDLVPVRDATALAGALRALMDDPARCRRYGEAGRQLATSRFSVEAVIEKTLDTYMGLLGAR